MARFDRYWKDSIVKDSLVEQMFSRRRFMELRSVLHACKAKKRPRLSLSSDEDPSEKVQFIVDTLNANAGSVWNMRSRICVDEDIIPFRGRTKLRQYMPMKPHKWGIKV